MTYKENHQDNPSWRLHRYLDYRDHHTLSGYVFRYHYWMHGLCLQCKFKRLCGRRVVRDYAGCVHLPIR